MIVCEHAIATMWLIFVASALGGAEGSASFTVPSTHRPTKYFGLFEESHSPVNIRPPPLRAWHFQKSLTVNAQTK